MSITSSTEQSPSSAGTGSMLNKQARPDVTSTRWQCQCLVKKSHPWTIWAKGVAWQHTGYTNNTYEALSWTKGGTFLCKMSLTLLVFKRYAIGGLSSTEDVNESSRWDSVPIRHNSVQQHTGTVHNYSNSCSALFWPQTLRIAFESRAFSCRLFHSNESCSLLFVSLTCLHRISRCPKEKQY